MRKSIYEKINPFAKDAKIMRTREALSLSKAMFEDFPNFHKSGSIRGMKKLYYGKGALLVKCDDYIYNVSSDPQLYYQFSI